MPEVLFHNESPIEYFRELVESAMQHQQVAVRELTSFYVVKLLAGFVHLERSPHRRDDEALGIRFAKALQSAGIAQRDGLRQVGDRSLFISGFFADSLNRGSSISTTTFSSVNARTDRWPDAVTTHSVRCSMSCRRSSQRWWTY